MQTRTTTRNRYQVPFSDDTNHLNAQRPLPSPSSSQILQRPTEVMKPHHVAKRRRLIFAGNTPPRRQYSTSMPPVGSPSPSDPVCTPEKVVGPNNIGERPTAREGLPDTNHDAQEQLASLLTTPNHRSSPVYVRTPGFPIDTAVWMSPELWQPALPDSPEPIPIGLWDPANYHPRTPGLSPASDQKTFGRR